MQSVIPQQCFFWEHTCSLNLLDSWQGCLLHLILPLLGKSILASFLGDFKRTELLVLLSLGFIFDFLSASFIYQESSLRNCTDSSCDDSHSQLPSSLLSSFPLHGNSSSLHAWHSPLRALSFGLTGFFLDYRISKTVTTICRQYIRRNTNVLTSYLVYNFHLDKGFS